MVHVMSIATLVDSLTSKQIANFSGGRGEENYEGNEND